MATRPSLSVLGGDHVSEGAGRINHHRLTVLAAGLGDVVQLAGGWLFDQSRGGWDVDVWLPGRCDVRPLTILGVRPLDEDSGTVLRELSGTGVLAVTAELLRVDPGVRTSVVESAKRTGSVLAVLGAWPAELGSATEPDEHRLSVAARAFKNRALAAAAVADGAAATEIRYEIRADALRPLYPV